MYLHSKRSHVGHHNAVEVEEAGQAVRFRKKKAIAVGRGNTKPKGDLS
jgi:PiT family inorganic phosphate transporter